MGAKGQDRIGSHLWPLFPLSLCLSILWLFRCGLCELNIQQCGIVTDLALARDYDILDFKQIIRLYTPAQIKLRGP